MIKIRNNEESKKIGERPKTNAKNPFSDVKPDAFYYRAVLWVTECGVTNGTSDTTFSPNNHCTRGQIVIFLFRLKAGR